MSVRLSLALASALSLSVAACGGGTIHVEATLPGPSVDGGSGVLVTVPDGSSVCDRMKIYVYRGGPTGGKSVSSFPSDKKPIVEAGGFGTYSRDKPQCTMIAQLEPGDDYWVIVSLPSSSYTNGGYPSLPGTGSHPTSFRNGAYPVSAVKGKETRLDLTLSGY